ncbi:hypothetical protein P5V15_011910 [Pogonomyrmex californicus]
MAKFKKSLQDKEVPAVKCMKKSIVKKFSKRKDNKGSLSDTYRNDLKRLNVANKIARTVSTSTQNRKKRRKDGSRNKFDVKNIDKSNIPTRHLKNDKKPPGILQKVQINTDSKTKSKKRNKRRKQDVNLDNTNKNVGRAGESVKEKNKKLQISANKSDKTEVQQIKPNKILKLNKHKIKVNQLEKMLTNKLQTKQIVQPLTLRERMMTQLRASRFRFINETLYNNDSSESKRYFKEDPDAFKAYHAGYKQQLEQWPIDNVIADFGCGEARLAASIPHTVHSFDFIALNDKVKACDMAHTPLLMNSVHVVVFCLSLMGSNLNDYIIEANRVLKNNGILKIAEVESRFEDIGNFIKLLRSYGFRNTWKDLSHNLFYFMDFKKEEDISIKRKNLPQITLKSCLYKKR